MNTGNRFFSLIRAALAGIMLALSPALPALSPPPPMPVEALTDFYAAMNGDDWHRNDGWLDPEVDVCDWYGITCVTEGEEFGGYEWIGYIRLPDNNLRGSFDLSLIGNLNGSSAVGMPSIELDLSGNAISGELPSLPLGIPRLILANNQLEGPLPPQAGHNDGPIIGTPPPAPPVRLEYLDLSGNQFSGVVPEAWQGAMTLNYLDLSGNRLDEGLSNAFAALDPDRRTSLNLADNAFSGPLPIDLMLEDRLNRLDLSGNAFSGEIPASLTAITQLFPTQYSLGGLNLCWNDLQPAESVELHDWLTQHHVGVRYERCLGVDRGSIDRSISGSRFEPSRSGEGTTMHLLETGQALVYWFTYTERGQQMWLTGMSSDVDFERPWLHFDLIRPKSLPTADGGRFFRYFPMRGQLRYDQLEDDSLGGLQVYDINISMSDYTPQPVGLRVDHLQLTRLNGTRCEDDELPQLSGAWYNPEIESDGFVVEVLPDRRALVYWFTWVPDSSNQAWMVGTGELDKNLTIQIDEMTRPVGGYFNEDFNPEAIVREDWGSLSITFEDESQAQVTYSSHDERWGAGEYPLERLSVPMPAECE